MDEQLFARLAERLALSPDQDVVLASVLETDGATPRKSGSRMLITAAQSDFSVGGGQLEARVIAAARQLLAGADDSQQLHIDLHGRADSAGVCGGRLRIALRRWRDVDGARAQQIQSALEAGETVTLNAAEQGSDVADACLLRPNPRLLIVGAGHCGRALYAAAQSLGFDLWVHDSRREQLASALYPNAQCLVGEAALLAQAANSARPLYAVLLNRDYGADVAALSVLLPLQPAFVGMMGSRRRIAQVLADPALREHSERLAMIHAPIGLAIGAQTPAEIAVSILAQLIAERARLGRS